MPEFKKPEHRKNKPQRVTIKEYLKAKYFRDNRSWVLSGGVLFTNVNGEWMNEKEFNNRYPVPTKAFFWLAEENQDGRRKYLL